MEFFFFVPFIWLVYVLSSNTNDVPFQKTEKTLFKLNHLDSFSTMETLSALSKMQDILLEDKPLLFKRDEQSFYGFYFQDIQRNIMVKVRQRSDDLFFDVYYDGKHFLTSDYDLVRGQMHNLQTVTSNAFHLEMLRNFVQKCAARVVEIRDLPTEEEDVHLFDVLKELVHQKEGFIFQQEDNKKMLQEELLSITHYETSKYQSTQLLWNDLPLATAKFVTKDNHYEIRFANNPLLNENHKFYIQLLFDKINQSFSTKKALLESSGDAVLLDKDILQKTNEIIMTIQEIEIKNPNMNKTQKYMLDRIKNEEIFHLTQNYSRLSDEERTKKLPIMLDSLENILTQLKEINEIEGLENMNAFQKSALVIKKRYKKK